MHVAAVVVAGGHGERFGGLKQFALLEGSTLAARSVAVARSVAEHVVLVVPDGYSGGGEGADVTVIGGPTRSASVRSGLSAVADAEIVVIHDAARPCASAQLFEAVVQAVSDGAHGAVPGLAITDTIKRVERGNVIRVVGTVLRDDLVTVQTPQAFRRVDLAAAHVDEPEATDDAALLELLGLIVVVVPGERTNLKVTTSADLVQMALWAGASA